MVRRLPDEKGAEGRGQGSLLFRERVADDNDPLVENLLQNGAIVLGKTNVPELCAGAQTYNR